MAPVPTDQRTLFSFEVAFRSRPDSGSGADQGIWMASPVRGALYGRDSLSWRFNSQSFVLLGRTSGSDPAGL